MVHDILAVQGLDASEISYHVWWPAENDPWYVASASDITIRCNFYGIQWIPYVHVDGHLDSNPDSLEVSEMIQERIEVPSHVWMSVHAWANMEGDFVIADVKVVADSALGTNVRLHMAITERYTHWSAPAPNGQQDFYGALLRMQPNGNGQMFTHSGDTADTLSFPGEFEIGEVNFEPWALENLRVVAWVQANGTREVLQSQFCNLPYLHSPHFGDTLYVGLATDIVWTESAFADSVTLQIDRDYPSGEWETVFEHVPNTGSLQWSVTGPPSDQTRFRLFDSADTCVCDTTDGDIIISAPATIAASPNPVTGELIAGDSLWTFVVVSNTGAIPAHGGVWGAPGMNWASPVYPNTELNVPPGGTDTVWFCFDARPFDGDTVLTGTWEFTGNWLPFEISVMLTVAANAVGDPTVPLSFSVSEAYPNPFNVSSQIRFKLEKPSRTTLTVYSATGREVTTLFDGILDAGMHEQRIDASHWASGLYFLHVNAGDHRAVRKLLLLK